MLFNTFNFLIVFPFIFILFWLIPAKWEISRKLYLLLLSYLLYMNFNAVYALILLGITCITYFGGQLFDNHKNKRYLFILLTFLSVFPLLVFKYYNFIIETVNDGLSLIGLRFNLLGLNWMIPVGISFYTFQAIGYMFDVYYGRCKSEKNILDYALFVSFFPQIVSGPISKASELLPQFKSFKKFDYEKAVVGLRCLLWGIFMKVVVADRAGIYADMIFANYDKFSGLNCFLGSIIYSIQIYTDFAGYSLMAVGVAKLLGFDLINNFRRPYFATSITDFWKRWHISLTRWLTQNVYIPLGGNRCTSIKCYWNILITFLVSGIWHGANWTFIVWGLLHGFIQIIEKSLGIHKNYSSKYFIFRIIFTFLIVNFAWIFFRSVSIRSASEFIIQIFSGGTFSSQGIETLVYLLMGFIVLFSKEFMQEFMPTLYGQLLSLKPFRWIAYIILIIMIMLNGVFDGGQFIYSSF